MPDYTQFLYFKLPEKQKIKIPDEEVVNKYMSEVMYIMENPINKGFELKDNKYYPYVDKDNAGIVHYNIGPGIEKGSDIGSKLDYSGKTGYTKEYLDSLLYPDLLTKMQLITDSWRNDSFNGIIYKDSSDTLSMGPRLIALDIAHNVKSKSKKANLPIGWPKLTTAFMNGDIEGIKKNAYSGSKRRQKMRNDLIHADRYLPINLQNYKPGGKINNITMNYLDFFKKGGKPKIHIKESQKGSFTRYCKGKVTNECIQRGKNSPDPKIRKKATFALNARAWKHQTGGELINPTKGTFFSRTKVEIPEQKKYTAYIPEDNTTSTTQKVTASGSSTSYDLSGYTLPTVTITTSTASKSDNKLHADINGLLDLFNKYNVRVRVTSGYREDATTSNGSQSHHATGRAIDVVPEDGDFTKLAQVIRNTPEIRDYMISKGLGILDETTKEMLARTGGSGAHYHIGPDKIAQNFWATLT